MRLACRLILKLCENAKVVFWFGLLLFVLVSALGFVGVLGLRAFA